MSCGPTAPRTAVMPRDPGYAKASPGL